jgi:pimeloyl-ACP methyl ester carboxylesterase
VRIASPIALSEGSLMRIVKVVTTVCATVLAAVVLSGAAWEQWSRHRVEQQFPPRGVRVDVGGHELQLDCRGTGSPIVVFESGLDANGSLSWYRVQDTVARFTRACSYSRAGILWSQAASGPRDANAITQDLHLLLMRAGESPPYVLVGHSMGGPYIVNFTQHYGDDVVGLVMVDPSHPEQRERTTAITGEDPLKLSSWIRVQTLLGWTGIHRLDLPSSSGQDRELQIVNAYRPVSRAEELREFEAIPDTFAEVAAAHDLGARPLVVLSGERIDFMTDPPRDRKVQAAWIQMHMEQAAWSRRGRHILVPDAGHRIQFDDPRAVVDATRSVVDAARRISTGDR